MATRTPRLVAVACAIALTAAACGSSSHNNAGSKGTSTSSGNGGPGASTAPPAQGGGKGSGGAMEVNGGGKTVGTKPPPTDATTTTATTTAETTTTEAGSTTTGTGGGIHVRGSIPSFVILHPKLNYQASPKFGEFNLSNGFSPDPTSVGFTDGGDVNVNYLGGSCSGFASSAPTVRINFGGGGASLLRIYIVGANGDPSMVVNDPYGNYYCVDDSFGTVNPTIDFNNPAGGTYDIWAASFGSGVSLSGTLFVTENSGNHP